LALVVLAFSVRAAQADDDPTHFSYRAVIDRAELEPSSLGGQRLRVYLSALAIGGQLLDLSDGKSVKLTIGGGEHKYPYALGTYAATGSTTDIVVLVQITSDFADALPMISDAIDRELLAHLNDKVHIGIATYGDAATVPKLTSAKQLRGKVALSTDNSAADPALSDAIDRALIVLKKKAEPDARKMIVVLGDGRDAAGDHDRITRTGERAAKEGVRIHTIAYSPADLRRPLLVLGELSKRSLGTLRWPGQGHKPTVDSWTEAFRQLADEIDKQTVLTFFAPSDDDLAGKKLKIITVGRTETASNEIKIPELTAAAAASAAAATSSGHPVLRWVLIIGGCLVGLVVLLGVVGFVMSKRAARPMPMPGMAAMPGMPPTAKPAAAAPGLLPNGRPIPALLITGGPRAGERLMLRHGFWIGKQPGCDLLIQDGYTSSQHAQITMDATGNCRLYDYNSTNGTFVDNQRVSDVALVHGSTIRIGSTELRFLAQ
jgi:hypothetical protein